MLQVWLGLFGILAIATPAGAIDFGAMNVGCSWDVRHSDGTTRTSTFLGRVEGSFTVETFDSLRPEILISVIKYSDNGYMTFRTWSENQWERFSPFSCFEVLGVCSYLYERADGTRITMHSSVYFEEGHFVSDATPDGGQPYPTEQFELGPFGITLYTRAQNYSTELIGFHDCVLPSS